MDNRPVVALDIDGTLGNYHAHFLRFAEGWYGREFPDPELNTGGIPLFRWMGTSKATYRQCKLAYRQGGMKRSMPVYPGASELTRHIRKRGARVLICTTRPFLRLDNIDPDTRHWLRRNRIQYDGVLYGPYKYRDLARNVGSENVLFAVDDLPEMLRVADAAGIKAYLRLQPYNTRWSGEYQTVEDMDRVRKLFDWHMERRDG